MIFASNDLELSNTTFHQRKLYFFGTAEFWAIFWPFLGQNSKAFKHRGFIYQNEALEPVIPKNVFLWSIEVTLIEKWGNLRSFRVNIHKFSNIGVLYIEMKLLSNWLWKTYYQGQSRSHWSQVGVIRGHSGSKFVNFQTWVVYITMKLLSNKFRLHCFQGHTRSS